MIGGGKQPKTCFGVSVVGGRAFLQRSLYDIPDTNEIEGKSRLDMVWEHAKRLRDEQGAKVYWYTPKLGFNENDVFVLVSLEDILESLKSPYPAAALILRVDVQQKTFFVLSFPARNKKESSGFSSVIYEPQNIRLFLSGDGDVYNRDENLFRLFVEIVSSDGVSSDYVDSKDGKMSLFRHVKAKKTNNNWIWNGIKKLL